MSSVATDAQLLRDLAVVLGSGALTALIFKRFGLPLVFGFLVAGFVIGPHTPPFQLVQDEASIQTLANLGVVLLLFGLGLDFDFRRLRRVGTTAMVVMVTEVFLMFWLGFELAQYIGWGLRDSIFLGAMISISSTAIIVKVLRDLGRLEAKSSQIVFGVLVLEDIAAILMLVLLSGYAATGGFALGELALVGARMGLFLLSTLLVGLVVVPRFIDYVVHRHGQEVMVLTVIGLAFGFAILSELAGFHVGLGAFLMGSMVAEARRRDIVIQHLRPIHDLFAAIFFVSIGMLVDLDVVRTFWKPVVAIFLIVVLGKLISGALATFLVGHAPHVAIGVGSALAQMGEFSFVIATLGLQTGVTSDFLFPVIVGAAALTSFTAPLMIRYSEQLGRGLAKIAPDSFRTYARFYTNWMENLRSRASPAGTVRRARERRAAIASGFLLILVLGGGWLLQNRGHAFLSRQGLADPASTLTYWGLVLSLLIPLVFRFYQAIHRWIDTWEIPGPSLQARGARRARNVVMMTFYLLGAILFGLPVLAATAPFLDVPLIAVAWVGMVGSAAVILWASISRLHSRITENVQSLLDDKNVHLRSPRVVQDLLATDYPWELQVDTVLLPSRGWATGKKLGELELRSATGASLILIERGDQRQETPGPNTTLLPGDQLTLIGNQEQLQAAKAVLLRPAPTGPPRPEMRLGRLFVTEGSALDQVRLSEAALPARSGLQVVAIVRDEKAIANPGANERLRAGDILLVLGPQQQIADASALVGPPAKPPPDRKPGPSAVPEP